MIESLPIEGANIEFAGHSSFPHVLLVVDQFPKTLGGGERAALNLAENLPKHGFDASILTFFVHPDCTDSIRPTCPIYVLPLQRTYGVRAIRAAVALRRFLYTQNVQIVQTFFESSDLWAGFVVKATSHAKLVWSRRDMGILRERKHRIAYRLMSRMPDAVLTVSEQVRHYCIQEDGIDPAKIQTVYNGIDLTRWDFGPTEKKHAGEMVVTTVGNIRRVKGHDLLIRAAGMIGLRFPGAVFSIAGAVLEPNFFDEIEALVSELGLCERFRFSGGVVDTRSHLVNADVFVLPSRSEGFSNAIIEAMAVGLPVVATDVGGNAEAVEDGVSGIIVPPEDPPALAKAIADMLSNPVRAQAMGAAGKAIVEKKFSLHAMMDGITSVYGKVLAES